MEPSSEIINDSVGVRELTPWNETQASCSSFYPISESETFKSPYTFSTKLNSRIILWEGDIANINADATVHSFNKFVYDKKCAHCKQMYEKTGPELRSYISNCQTGEVIASKAYCSPARYILHTASPFYNIKYRTAAETALKSCYKNVLRTAYDLGVKTLALCAIHSARYNYPPHEGAHIALRCVRKFLEMQEERGRVVIEKIVLVSERGRSSIYEVLCPLYFPRSAHEEQRSALQLSPGKEKQIRSSRKIRIIENPQNVHYGNDTLISLQDHSFTRMQDDWDRERLLGEQVPLPTIHDQLLAKRIHDSERYERLLRQAKTEDLTEISNIGCLYQSGFDCHGRPVIVIVGKWFRFKDINLDKALLYLIHLLDPLVRGDYVVMYFHTSTSSINHPPLQWLRDVYTILPYKYKKNLKAFYVVHPTIWTKMMVWWFTTFMAPAIKQKIVNTPGLEYLYTEIGPKDLEIPAFITEYDMTINGIRYYQPRPSSASSTDSSHNNN